MNVLKSQNSIESINMGGKRIDYISVSGINMKCILNFNVNKNHVIKHKTHQRKFSSLHITYPNNINKSRISLYFLCTNNSFKMELLLGSHEIDEIIKITTCVVLLFLL